MKVKSLSSILLFVFLLSNSSIPASVFKGGNPAPSKGSQPKCLELSCSATLQGKPLRGFTMCLYKGDKLVTKASVSGSSPKTWLLEQNAIYTICFSKPGCLERRIQVNTSLPEGVSPNPVFQFDVEMEMLTSDMESATSDFPVGIISFDSNTQKFERSQQYTKGIRKLSKEPDLTSNSTQQAHKRRK